MSPRQKPKTAAELRAELNSDPAYHDRIAQQEHERREHAEDNLRASSPVLAELTRAGFDVRSIADLYNRKLNYQEAIPVLLRWLPIVSNPATKESIVRALTVPWAKPQAALPLIDEFRKAGDSQDALRWAIGNALEQVADDSAFDELVSLATDRRFGKSREMVVLALGNLSNPKAVDVLRELLADDMVVGHAAMALGRLRAASARSELERVLHHHNPWVRTEAKRALARLDGNP